MSEVELSAAAEALAKELAPFIKLGKMIKWLIGIVVMFIMGTAGVAIWVHGVNVASATQQQAIMDSQQALVQFESRQAQILKDHEAETATRDRENRQWQVEKDAMITKLSTNQEMVLKILDHHEKFIEAHGWPGVMHNSSVSGMTNNPRSN